MIGHFNKFEKKEFTSCSKFYIEMTNKHFETRFKECSKEYTEEKIHLRGSCCKKGPCNEK